MPLPGSSPSIFERALDPDLVDDGSGHVAARHGGATLRTHFQPIYSLSHRRVVGHEALLRGRGDDGLPVAPPVLFERCADAAAVRRLDWLASLTHCTNFARARRPNEWLFLNVHPGTFAGAHEESSRTLESLFVRHVGLPPQQVVLEVLEHAIDSAPEFEAEIARLRALGCLIALDDFGAGHSNFDRVWRLRPHIVKLDRSVIVRAATDRAVRRVTSQMVSMLHECGALVLMEGIENADEAHIALDSDVDFVQGYFFGLPRPDLVDPLSRCGSLEAAWQLFDERWMADRNLYRERMAPYRAAIADAAAKLSAGLSAEQACRGFLSLPDADTCYLLDSDGFQVGRNLDSRPDIPTAAARSSPLSDTRNARWSRRPYFRRALNAPGTVQVTRPYLTMTTSRLCVTVSVSFRLNGNTLIICGDLPWKDEAVSPGGPPLPVASTEAMGLF